MAQPVSPTPLSPGINSESGEDILTLTPSLQWTRVSGADYYAIAISKYPYGSSNIVYNNQQVYGTSTTIPDGKLVAGEKYHWNMQAHNNAGWSLISSTLYFSTPSSTPAASAQAPATVQITLVMHDGSTTGSLLSSVQVSGQDGDGVAFSKPTDSSGAIYVCLLYTSDAADE